MPDVSNVLVPRFNVNDDQAIVAAWLVQSGDYVRAEQPIATLETTKAAFDVFAERAGFISYEHLARTVVPVGSVLARISDQRIEQVASAEPPRASGQGAAPDRNIERLESSEPDASVGVRVSRKALRRMRELGVTRDQLPPSGRFEVADVERIAAERNRSGAAANSSYWESLEQSTSKAMEAVRLASAYRSIVPSLVTVPLSSERLQAELRKLAADIGPVSTLELVIHRAAPLLREFRDLNGFFADGRAWTYRDVAIGFAVHVPGALQVPVVRDAARLSQLEVCRVVRDLSLRCFRRELSVSDVSGATFTVTDLSGSRVTQFVPVLNDRQSAILGICAPTPQSKHQNLVLAFDHRISDGLRASEFLGTLVDTLEHER